MKRTSKTTNVLLWIAQILLSAGFIWAAFMKICQPAEKLAAMWPWTAEIPELVKLTGMADLALGICILLPSLLKIQSNLTVYAAFGTTALMTGAVVFHIWRGESSQIAVNIVFTFLSLFVAWGRSAGRP